RGAIPGVLDQSHVLASDQREATETGAAPTACGGDTAPVGKALPRPTQAEGSGRKVCVSYAWGDDSPQGKERKELVERLCARLSGWGYRVVRDKEDMRPGDLISGFLKRIGQGDRVVVILSEKYLRSVHCMNELHEIYETSRREKEDFLRRIIPLTLKDARIGTIRERAGHARYWQHELAELQQ